MANWQEIEKDVPDFATRGHARLVMGTKDDRDNAQGPFNPTSAPRNCIEGVGGAEPGRGGRTPSCGGRMRFWRPK